MTEKEGNNQGAFWDISENTNVDPERIIDEPDNTSNQFQPHEPREVAKYRDFFDVMGRMILFVFALIAAFSFISDTYHLSPWECPNKVTEVEDGTYRCQNYGIQEPWEYDSSGIEIIEPMDKVIAVMMYIMAILLFAFLCWGTFSKKQHLRHLGEENAIVLMTSRFGMTPRLKKKIILQYDSFIQRTTGEYTDEDGMTTTYNNYEIHTKGQNPFELSQFTEEDYVFVTGLEIRE